MSNSNLVDFTLISPHRNSPRNNKIKKITIHHMAGNLSVERCGSVFQSRRASTNYGIDSKGRVGLYVDEGDRSWASASSVNDHQAVTMEVANDENGGNWHVGDVALKKCIELCTDICKRNGIPKLNYTGNTSGNLTRHNMFTATTCPGSYLQSKFDYIANSVNKILDSGSDTPTDDTLYRVQVGAYKNETNAKNMEKELNTAGYDTYIVAYDGLYKVQTGAFREKENAKEYSQKIIEEGFDAYITTSTGKAPSLKSINVIAKEVIDGKWGNGQERKDKLTNAGYDADEIQKEVNRLL